MKKLIVTAAVLVASTVCANAQASSNYVADTSQKGSLLVFPKIDVSEGRTTLVGIQNDYPHQVLMKCYYMDFYKNKRDFQIVLTREQPFWFNAKTGEGTVDVPPFPRVEGGSPYGELKCWAVDGFGHQQISWNHLAGQATVVDYQHGTAYEYSSWNFAARGVPAGGAVGAPGKLELEGNEGTYDACPEYLLAKFAPYGSYVGLDGRHDGANGAGAVAVYGNTDLSVAGCKQDFRQDMTPIYTKLKFDVWNEHEVKFTGAYQCTNSWHEMYLTDIGTKHADHFNGTGAEIFTADQLGNGSARFRVAGIHSDRCEPQIPADAVVDTGLVGVIATEIGIATPKQCSEEEESCDPYTKTIAVSGTNLNTAGARRGEDDGFILWDPQLGVVPESIAP